MQPDQLLQTQGWVRFDYSAVTRAWAAHARRASHAALRDPANEEWHQCEGTWFVGVDALKTDIAGQLPNGPELAGPAVDFLRRIYGPIPDLHPAQLSVMFPGYPRPKGNESETAFGYRLRRDAAHVDGVKMFSDSRRRRVEEPHAWVLGVPLNETSPDASPLVVWEGSHVIMRRAFQEAFAGTPRGEWHLVDVTDIYSAARREVFETCSRITVHAKPGEAYVMHRLCLHGVAPWAEGATAPGGEGRMIAYFRPEVADWTQNWLRDI